MVIKVISFLIIYILIGIFIDLYTRDSDEDLALSIICVVIWPGLLAFWMIGFIAAKLYDCFKHIKSVKKKESNTTSFREELPIATTYHAGPPKLICIKGGSTYRETCNYMMDLIDDLKSRGIEIMWFDKNIVTFNTKICRVKFLVGEKQHEGVYCDAAFGFPNKDRIRMERGKILPYDGTAFDYILEQHGVVKGEL